MIDRGLLIFSLTLFDQQGQRLFNGLSCERFLNKILDSHPDRLRNNLFVPIGQDYYLAFSPGQLVYKICPPIFAAFRR